MYDVNVGVNLGVLIPSPELLQNNGQPFILNIHNGRVVSFIELVRVRSMCRAAEYVVMADFEKSASKTYGGAVSLKRPF